VNDPAILTTVIQGGAFALIAWYFVYGLDKRDKMLERIQEKFVTQIDKHADLHRQELDAARAERIQTHKQCEEGHAQKTRALEEVSEVLQAVKHELQKLVDRSDVHYSLPHPQQPQQQRRQSSRATEPPTTP